MTKKIVISILCLALISLACLEVSAAVVATTQPSQVATRSKTLANPTAPATAISSPTPAGSEVCAVVVATETQNLRAYPGTNGQVINYLRNGDVVRVLDQVSADWWSVKRGNDIGFARSSFLEEVECVK